MTAAPPRPRSMPHKLVTDAPPMLTPLVACVAEVRGEWFLLETKTHQEKALAWELCDLGLPYYLPLAVRIKQVAHFKRRYVLPLFPNYLFAAGDEAQKFCLESRRVLSQPIRVVNQKQLVRELSSIEIALFSNPELEVIEVRDVGQRVRVTGGPLEGMEGFVEEILHERSGPVRVVVRVEMLGKGTPMSIDRSDLEPCP